MMVGDNHEQTTWPTPPLRGPHRRGGQQMESVIGNSAKPFDWPLSPEMSTPLP